MLDDYSSAAWAPHPHLEGGGVFTAGCAINILSPSKWGCGGSEIIYCEAEAVVIVPRSGRCPPALVGPGLQSTLPHVPKYFRSQPPGLSSYPFSGDAWPVGCWPNPRPSFRPARCPVL